MKPIYWASYLGATLAGLFLLQPIGIQAADSREGLTTQQRMLRDATMAMLREGNARFASGQTQHPNMGAERRKSTVTEGQQPFATILACSDSRDPVELIFDRGIGDLFIVRVAGNVAGESELASVEYGVGHLETPLLVVMGHTKCGAVTAVATGAQLHGHLPLLAARIKPAADKAKEATTNQTELVANAIKENVWQVIENILKQSPEMQTLAKEGKVTIIGALYDLETGVVTWMGAHPNYKELLGGSAGDAADGHGAAEPKAPAASEHPAPAPAPQPAKGHDAH